MDSVLFLFRLPLGQFTNSLFTTSFLSFPSSACPSGLLPANQPTSYKRDPCPGLGSLPPTASTVMADLFGEDMYETRYVRCTVLYLVLDYLP